MNKFENLLTSVGLYDAMDISVNDIDELESLLCSEIYHGYKISCYCKECGEERVFENVDKTVHEDMGFVRFNIFDEAIKATPSKKDRFDNIVNKRYSLCFQCAKENSHLLLFDLILTSDKIIKIGQYPSYADIATADTKKYKSILADKYVEYNKSVGLFSHGVGIGSFVYLRRIIEKLVFDTYEKNKDNLKISEKEFVEQEFKFKIVTLKEYLPEVLVENKNIYEIISKGIHELSEKECLEYYPGVKMGIELILDDLIAEKERERKKKELSKFVANTTGKLKNN